MSCTCPTGEDLYKIIRHNIKESGYHVQYIFRGENSDPFFYTIGLTETFGIPELFLGVDTSPNTSMHIIWDVINDFKKRGVKYGINTEILHDMQVCIQPVDTDKALNSHMFQLAGYYGHNNFSIAQILLPDINGVLPGETGYNMPQTMLDRLILN